MAFFHDEEDAPGEPVPGLPGALPDGENIIWQGAPQSRALAIHAFHIRFVAAYFALVGAFRFFTAPSIENGLSAAALILVAGLVTIAVLYFIAASMARAALFTITNKRVVFRFGAAIRKYVNLPFSEIESVSVRPHRTRSSNDTGPTGDIALGIAKKTAPPYFHLWPFVRPLKINAPTPLIRAIADADKVGAVLAQTMKNARPKTVRLTEPTPSPVGAAANLTDGPLIDAGAH